MRRKTTDTLLYIAWTAVISGLSLWILHGRYGFNLADEGFYWYGSQQASQGQIPGLDFSAYEPGRYYITAAIFKLTGSDSNRMARISSTVFTALSYGVIGGWLMSEQKGVSKLKSLMTLTLLAISLSIWTFPYYRATDVVAPCACYATCYLALTRPTAKGALIAGVAIGTLMFFGRNHAAYTAYSLLIVNGWMWLKQRDFGSFLRRCAFGIAGFCIGIIPFIIIALARAEYIPKITQQWLELLVLGKTNYPLPWPLPWLTISAGMPITEADGHLIVGFIFMGLFVIGIGCVVMIAVLCSKGRLLSPEILAMTATTSGYLHYAIDRSDLEHIGPASMGILLGVTLWCTRKGLLKTSICYAAVALITVRVALRQQAIYHCVRGTLACVNIKVDNESDIIASQEIANTTMKYIKEIGGERFLAIPAFPTLYAMMGVRSPIWDIYMSLPRNKKIQNKAISSIKNSKVTVVIINDDAFGDTARISLTNNALFKFISQNYKECPNYEIGGALIMRNRFSANCFKQLRHGN